MADKAPVTPEILRWARTTAHMTVEEAAAKAQVKPYKIKAWELGEETPTIKQAEKLAKLYRRPFAVFFLSEPPKDFLPLQDFRKSGAAAFTSASIFTIRDIQNKQAWARELMQELDQPPLPFVGKFDFNHHPPEVVAADILHTLKLNPPHYSGPSPLRQWVDAAENNGIFVSRSKSVHNKLPIDPREMQGFAIADPYAPFVFINTQDWNSAQLFTLVHELAHIWIAQTGISNEVSITNSEPSAHPIESYCNKVAASALIPDEVLKKINWKAAPTHDSIFNIAKGLGVSTLALTIQAHQLSFITAVEYQRIKRTIDQAFQKYVEGEKSKKMVEKNKKGPSPYLIRTLKNGIYFSKVVFDAWHDGTIQATTASTLLNTPVFKFPKLERFIYR